MKPSRIFCLSLLCASVLIPPTQAQTTTATIAQQVGLDQHLDAQLPLHLKFRDESGREVALREYFGDKPVILCFVYFRCPMLCTQVLNGVLKSTNALPLVMNNDYEIVSISIDPRETPEMAAAKKEKYVAKYRRPGAKEGWHFLTGHQAAIDEITRVAGFRYQYDEPSDQYAHASGIMVVTPSGRISRYFYGIDYHPTDLRLGLVESSENKIGTAVDQILLLCYHYDPKTGRYGLVISGAIRIAGAITVLALGAFLWINFRKEQQRTTAVKQAEESTKVGHGT